MLKCNVMWNLFIVNVMNYTVFLQYIICIVCMHCMDYTNNQVAKISFIQESTLHNSPLNYRYSSPKNELYLKMCSPSGLQRCR